MNDLHKSTDELCSGGRGRVIVDDWPGPRPSATATRVRRFVVFVAGMALMTAVIASLDSGLMGLFFLAVSAALVVIAQLLPEPRDAA